MSESLEALLNASPPARPADLLPDIREALRRSGRNIVVLDDDPTGTKRSMTCPC